MTTPGSLKHARFMRQQPTPAKHKLWQAIRTKQVWVQRWRHQALIGPYIVDFCPQLRLVIEVDAQRMLS